jgi:hypothetical protein
MFLRDEDTSPADFAQLSFALGQDFCIVSLIPFCPPILKENPTWITKVLGWLSLVINYSESLEKRPGVIVDASVEAFPQAYVILKTGRQVA